MTISCEQTAIRAVDIKDAASIARIMRDAQAALPDKSMYLINTEALVQRRIERGILGDVIEVGGEVVAFCLYRNPPAKDAEASFGFRPQVPEEDLGHLMNVATIAVDPRFQKRGLGRRLLERVDQAAAELDCKYLMTTVDPRNAASMGNFTSAGYEVVATIEAYSSVSKDYVFDVVPAGETVEQGLIRNVLCKSLGKQKQANDRRCK